MPRRRSKNRSGRAVTTLIGVALTIGALITAFPFIWMIATSVKPQSESLTYPPTIFPRVPTFKYFSRLFVELDFGTYLVNTIGVVLIGFIGLLFM